MNKKLVVTFKIMFALVVGWSGTSATYDILFPIEVDEIEVCIDFDEVLNYCNESEMRETYVTPFWMNLFFVVGSFLVLSIWIPRIIKDLKEIRYGLKANWDDEFKGYKN